MLRIIQNTSAAGAKSYYGTADYYSEGQELEGNWRGEAAARLGLSGAVGKEAWDALCDNRNPATGQALTPRRKQDRRVGYDFNFHVPKSVSLLYGLTEDARILEAFRASVDETMREMESEVKTRVRQGGKNEDRVSGNLAWGEFIHTTARPVNDIPDPHLHAHCFVFNITFDDKENRWKAAQFGDLKRDASYFEAKFHSRMALRMAELGLPVEQTRKGWEIAGISKASLNEFSRRTALIEKVARDKGITSDTEKSAVGAKTREKKQKNLSMDELRREWRSRLSSDEQAGLTRIAERMGDTPIPASGIGAKEAALRATEHCFERKSVVPERELLTQAIKRSVGLATVQATEQAIREQNLIVAERDGRRLVTTREVLGEEERMIDFARQGRGACAPLCPGSHEFREQKLNDGQRRAVLHVLNSPDQVMIIRGGAGVGKTTALHEAVEAIEANGKRVFTFAPSADASSMLRQDGFRDADTVARLLVDEKLQAQIAGNVVLIDEAGLLGTKSMARVFDLADKHNARVILSGDRGQHSPVDRGAALRLLETEAGLIPASIKDIQRQRGNYKEAVQALSEGRTADGFRQLDQLGWIKEVNDADRYKMLARDYVRTMTEGKSALAISPTHREAELVTEDIRSELKRTAKPRSKRQEYMLGQDEREFLMLENKHLTTAERRDPVNYTPGTEMIVFHQNAAKGIRKGARLQVDGGSLPLEQADKFAVFHTGTIPIAPGELIRITRNGQSVEGHRLNNGGIYTVKGFTPEGDLRLANDWTVSKDFGFLDHAYCLTSHASQGKTVDRVMISQSSLSFPASSREQCYVSVSRGRQQATLYTDDKKALQEAVRQSDNRLSATEFLTGRERGLAIERMEREQRMDVPRDQRIREGVTYER
jgi:conjugative relaxase-like TrwC/TraI family protein